jgi:hypothetical protein
MTFEIGDKVLTTTGLYMSGAWREKGLKGRIVDTGVGCLLTVKFKGIKERRFLRADYLILRKKAKVTAEELVASESKRPFQVGDSVVFTNTVTTGGVTVEVVKGVWAEVVELIPDSNLVVVGFDDGGELTVVEEVLASEAEAFAEEGEEEGSVPDLHEVKDNPEVQAALALVLERIEEIKALLTQGPRTEVVFTVHPSNGLSSEEVDSVLQEEEPAPEPVFKKAKEVKVGELLYTEGGAYDKVTDVQTKDSGYTSLFGSWGNQIVQVPSGRVVQVLEEVA